MSIAPLHTHLRLFSPLFSRNIYQGYWIPSLLPPLISPPLPLFLLFIIYSPSRYPLRPLLPLSCTLLAFICFLSLKPSSNCPQNTNKTKSLGYKRLKSENSSTAESPRAQVEAISPSPSPASVRNNCRLEFVSFPSSPVPSPPWEASGQEECCLLPPPVPPLAHANARRSTRGRDMKLGRDVTQKGEM